MESGRDENGCGNTTENACQTLLYLVQQVNRIPSLPSSTDTHTGNQTHLPPTTEVDTGNQTHPTLSTGGDTGNQTGLHPSTSNSTPPTPSAKGDTGDRTDLPPSRELRIITDKSLRFDQRTAVSTISLPLAVFVEIS